MPNLTRIKIRSVDEPDAERARPAGAAGKRGAADSISAAGEAPLTVSDDAVRIGAKIRASLAEPERVILFTGAKEKDGVSNVAAQVALALAQSAQAPVLLLDANPYAPSIDKLFDVPPAPGLYEVVEKRAELRDAVHSTATQLLSVLPAGLKSTSDCSLQSSAEYAFVLDELRRQFRYVVVDAPPVLRYADSVFIVEQSDAVVIVIAAGRHGKAGVVQLKQELEDLGAKILGLILSDA